MPIGRLVDLRGAGLLMTLGSAMAGLALIGLAGVHTLWQFYALWSGVLGLATALTFYPVSFTIVTNWFERRRGTALAVLTLLGGLASPIFIPLEGWLVLHLGWRMTLIVLGLTQLFIALPQSWLTSSDAVPTVPLQRCKGYPLPSALDWDHWPRDGSMTC